MTSTESHCETGISTLMSCRSISMEMDDWITSSYMRRWDSVILCLDYETSAVCTTHDLINE